MGPGMARLELGKGALANQLEQRLRLVSVLDRRGLQPGDPRKHQQVGDHGGNPPGLERPVVLRTHHDPGRGVGPAPGARQLGIEVIRRLDRQPPPQAECLDRGAGPEQHRVVREVRPALPHQPERHGRLPRAGLSDHEAPEAVPGHRRRVEREQPPPPEQGEQSVDNEQVGWREGRPIRQRRIGNQLHHALVDHQARPTRPVLEQQVPPRPPDHDLVVAGELDRVRRDRPELARIAPRATATAPQPVP